jgi:predicted GIY-YIG superfamily endonuclease
MKSTLLDVCYVIHFHEKYEHAEHYVGATYSLRKRLERHARGQGSPLLRACKEEGIIWTVSVLFTPGFETEQFLKRQNNTKRYCPLCGGEKVPPEALIIETEGVHIPLRSLDYEGI